MRDLDPDVRIKLDLPGGGGFYDPLTRDLAFVAEDIANDLLSANAAYRDYGVMLECDGKTIDVVATDRERAAPPERRAGERAVRCLSASRSRSSRWVRATASRMSREIVPTRRQDRVRRRAFGFRRPGDRTYELR